MSKTIVSLRTGKTVSRAETEADRAETEATAARSAQRRIKARLDQIDKDALRAMRAVAAGTDTEKDRSRLAALETEAAQLRARLEGDDS